MMNNNPTNTSKSKSLSTATSLKKQTSQGGASQQKKPQHQKSLSQMDPERQKCMEVLIKLKQAISTIQNENKDLQIKVTTQTERNKVIQDDQKHQAMHIETLNMMSKYQLVYIRLETALQKLIANIEAKKRLRLKRGFQAFKSQVFEQVIVNRVTKKKLLVCAKFELSLDLMIGAFERYMERVTVSQAFRHYKEQYLANKEVQIANQKNSLKMKEMQNQLSSTDKRIEQLQSREKELDLETVQTQRSINEQQKHQKVLSEREVKLNADYIQMLEKKNSGKQERVNVKEWEDKVHLLESQVTEVDTDNKTLQMKIETTNLSLTSYVNDMNSIMDQFDITNGQAMDVESVGGHDYEDEEEDDYMDDGSGVHSSRRGDTSRGLGSSRQPDNNTAAWGTQINNTTEYDEVRPHAGTGGSSKMRSRPTNSSQVLSHPQSSPNPNLNIAQVIIAPPVQARMAQHATAQQMPVGGAQRRPQPQIQQMIVPQQQQMRVPQTTAQMQTSAQKNIRNITASYNSNRQQQR